jgi:hypothetical protein
MPVKPCTISVQLENKPKEGLAPTVVSLRLNSIKRGYTPERRAIEAKQQVKPNTADALPGRCNLRAVVHKQINSATISIIDRPKFSIDGW